MSTPASVIVIGASAAGVSVVRTLRDLDYAGEILLLDSDVNGAYERPPLSKDILIDSQKTVESISLLSGEDIDRLNITVMWGAEVVNLNADSKTITLKDGDTHTADAIVLATGGYARSLPLPGATANGVFSIRDFSDAEALREKLCSSGKVAVIGGGFIGAESVASLSERGHQVVWMDAAPKPLAHVLPEVVCNSLLDWYEQQDVEIIGGAQISAFIEGAGQVTGIELRDRRVISVDAIVLGVGMAPQSQLAEEAGLTLNQGGICVDLSQKTSREGIYACGDVAFVVDELGQGKRHEHWQAAEHQGANAARSIVGEPLMDTPVAWFWSDQGPHHIEMAGHVGERSVVRVDGEWPVSFEMQDDKLVGVVSVNNPNAVRVGLRLLKQGITPPEKDLKNCDLDYRQLLKNK